MSIQYTGTGGLFTRLGKIFGTFNNINTFRGTTFPPMVNAIQGQYAGSNQAVIDNIYQNASGYQSSQGSYLFTLQSLASDTVLTIVNQSQLQSSITSMRSAMSYLIGQMNADGETVQKCHVSGSSASGTDNNGNVAILIGFKSNNGITREDVFAELISGVVTQDAQSNGATLGREVITFTGQASVGDALSFLYPAGSGCAAAVQCISGSQNSGNGTNNYLYNSDFEDWTTPNIPDGWTVSSGSPGTTINRSSVHYDGSYSLNFTGNGTELTAVYQPFGVAQPSGTPTNVLAVDQMAFNIFAKMDSTPSQGVLEIALVDESNVTTQDEQGVDNSISVDLTTLSTSWESISGFFRSPRVLPSSSRLMIRLTTALEAGKNLYLDRAALAEPFYLYVGGPAVAAFSGNAQSIDGDTYNLTIANDRDGQFQYIFDRFFNMKQMGLYLPSSDSPTISDSLIS